MVNSTVKTLVTGTKFFNAEFYLRAGLRVGIGLLMLSPYLIWLVWVPEWRGPSVGEWYPALFTAFAQAFWSAAFSLIAGFILFGASQAWTEPRVRRLSELSLLLPNMIPPIFLVLSMLSWVTPFIAFPYGTGAVIVAHVLLNAGLVAVALDRLVHSKIGGMAETAWTLGASRSVFWYRVAWPFLKGDVACIFLFVFGLCFTSFSIPLLLAGSRQVTLEVAIYDAIRMDGRWDKAVILAGCQSFVLLLLAWGLPHSFWPARPSRQTIPYLALRGVRLVVFLPSLILLAGWLFGVAQALKNQQPEYLPLVEAALTTLTIGLAVGLLHLFLFLVVAYVSPHNRLNRFLNGYLAPSSAITGFGMLLLPGEGDILSFMKLVFALTLLSFPLLYRWVVHSALSALRSQVTVARTLGASWVSILFEVVWPQCATELMRASGLAALWACGDFALTGIVAGEFNTVPILMEDLMGNYRIESAQLLMFPLLFIGLGLYCLFVGATRYVSR